MASQAPGVAEPAVRVEGAVTDDLTAFLGVEAGRGVEVAGQEPAADVFGIGRLEARQAAAGRVENGGLGGFVARAVVANGHCGSLRDAGLRPTLGSILGRF